MLSRFVPLDVMTCIAYAMLDAAAWAKQRSRARLWYFATLRLLASSHGHLLMQLARFG